MIAGRRRKYNLHAPAQRAKGDSRALHRSKQTGTIQALQQPQSKEAAWFAGQVGLSSSLLWDW
jgi:hypothetical protein